MMRGTRHRLVGVAWFIFVLVLVAAMLTAAYFLTTYLYTIAGLHPAPLLNLIVNAFLGLLFTGLLISAVTKFARSRRWLPERNVFEPIIEALEKIARGDFSIRLESELKDNPIVGELANSVNKMALELDQIENMRQEFISNVSHEIQSPLTSIRGFAQALEDDNLSAEERHHYLSIIESESTRLSRITEDLLKLASLESEHIKFEPKSYRLDKQIQSLVLACEPQWFDKKIDMQVSLEDISVVADEDLLSQVWLNLIHNSIKFTPPNGRISICLQQQGVGCQFTISDTGIGISNEDQARIFERFYKADTSRTPLKGGSGLGLSIAKKIVEMHKGTIAVESKLDAGTTFTVCLPE